MRVLHAEPGSTTFRAVPGPGDLNGKTGAVILDGSPANDAAAAAWTLVLGAFALRGGEIRRRRS